MKSWKDVKNKEINQQKKNYCLYCKYSSTIGSSGSKGNVNEFNGVICDYIGKTGKRRGCSPSDALSSKEGKAEGKRMSENDRKKEYLKGYQRALREIDRIIGLLQELQIDKMCPSLIQDGMPHGSGTSDLSGYMAKKENLEMRLLKAQEAALNELDDITDHIDRLRNENEIDVLFNRYIKDMGWEEIAVKMGYSWQWIHKIHSSALKNLRID